MHTRLAERADELREHLDREVPDWLERAESEGKDTTKGEAVRGVRTLASLLRVEGEERFVRHPGEADVAPEDVEVVEMVHTKSDRLPCNLAAGDDHPYDDINRRIYREAEAAGADVLVSIRHGCHRSLLVQEPDYDVTTKNYATFLAERLGYEYRDRNREYTRAALRGETDRILEDDRPVFEANGLPEAEARRIVETRFPAP